MKRYDSYKDSGVEWIGEVPSHWKVMKTSLAFHGIGSGTTPSTSKKEFYDENEGYYWLQTGDLNDGIINDTSKKVTKLAINQCNLKFYPKDSIVIAMYGATIGKVGILGIKTATNQACCVLPANKNMYAKFAFYEFLACKPALLVSAIGGGQPNISQDVIRKQKIVIPPLLEQTVIASYLDKKCSEIDKVISAQQKRIALLQELKQSIITHAVTKGLNPNVEMKDSGMEWIGKIPSHWDNLRLRFVCELRNGYTPSKANPDFWEDGTIPWYRMEDIRESGRKLNIAKQYITEEAVKGGGLFDAGSFILATTATIGEHAVLIVDSLANQRFTNLKIRKSLSQRVLGDYFFYYLYMIDDYCKATTKTSTFPAVSMELLKNCHIVFPSIEEQCKIIDYLDNKCSSIDSSISKAQHQVELLQEYKQSLITEVVTGKRKVS